MIDHKALLRHCVSIDLETTGIDEKRHAIISIGIARFDNDEDKFYRELIIPKDAECDPEALQVNGETEAQLRARAYPEYTPYTAALIEAVNWCKKRELGVIVGKNPSFDHRFMRHYWKLSGLPEKDFVDVLTYRHLDWSSFAIPLMLFKGVKIPQKGLGTLDIARFFGLPDEARPHIAINGANYNVNATRHVLDQYSANSTDPN
jgi:DNA polymerase III epsilon subunit-like protein